MMKKICMISFVLHFAAAGSGCASGNDKKAAEAAPAKVYMTRDISPAGMKAVYEALGRKAEGKKVAVKLSTGEPGGNNFLQPALIGDLVKSVKGTIVECNTAYGGGRAKTEDHLKAAADHGFTAIAPVDIMDAEGEVRLPVEGGRHLKYDIVGSHFPEYDFVVVLSHFKGHAMGGFGGAIKNTANIDTDSIYVVVNDNGVDATTGVVTLSYNDGLVADKTVDARLKDAFTKGVGAKEFAILSALDTPAFFDEKTEKFTEAGNKAFEQATGGNATAGVLNVAYDANAQVTDAIVRHQLSEHAGMGVWADVFYAKNEAKKLYGDFGYSADIYGGVLGFDYTAACGGTLGAALTVGTADADSEGGVLSNSLSSDFVGLSVYASKDFSGLNVKADLGYIDFSNDFTGLGDASDATTITFGVRGDFTAYQNGAFSVVPHMGLRYTRIDTDAVAFNDEQNMNVLEAPIGVKFAGTFEATGWKLVPSYDFTIVPQLGDKEVEAFGTAGDITILSGGLFNNVLGVEAVKDNMSFGLNASYGFGPDDRANTQVNANFRYHF